MAHDTDAIVANIERLRGAELEPDQKYEIEIWQRGKNLAAVPPHAWQEIEGMLTGYVISDTDALLAVDPKDKDEVLAKHAVAHASGKVLNRFLSDRTEALTAAQQAPTIVKAAVRYISQVPAESM